jgi:hypothetical protein
MSLSKLIIGRRKVFPSSGYNFMNAETISLNIVTVSTNIPNFNNTDLIFN